VVEPGDRWPEDRPGEETDRCALAKAHGTAVTAVEPDIDRIEMGFDDYSRKPIDAEELRVLDETLVLRQEDDEMIREYVARVSKGTAVQRRKTGLELETNEAHVDSSERLEQIEAQAHTALDTAIEAGKFDALVRALESGELDVDAGSFAPDPGVSETDD
jgi:DNA-binding response OmpR family regulator